MADTTLTNTASVTGNYNAVPITLDTDAVVTQLVDGLTVTKTADRVNWATGLLTYTITVTNNASSSLETPIVTDILDPTLIKLVESSVKVNGVAKTPVYNATTGEMTVTLDSIEVGGKSEITFQVQKAEP